MAGKARCKIESKEKLEEIGNQLNKEVRCNGYECFVAGKHIVFYFEVSK